jgi:hypothetical protein
VTPTDIETRLRSALDHFVDATPLAHPDHPTTVRASAHGPADHRRVFRMAPKTAGILVAAIVLAVVAVIVVGSRHPSSPSVPPTLPITGATATYPPIPRSVAGARGCLGLAPVGLSSDQAQAIIKAVMALAGDRGRLQEIGPCTGGPVTVALAPGQERLAHEIWTRYGGDVSLLVGLTAYHGSPGRSPRCGVLEPPSPLPAGLHLALRLRSTTVSSGSDVSGNVVVTNVGPTPYLVDTGQPLEAVVVRAGTRRVVGVYSGGIGGTGYGRRLAPGQSGKVPVIGGTARCDGGIGSALPPGRYQVLVRFASEVARGRQPAYLTPPVALRVVRP